MNIAIMQPYFFPYLGYIQLMDVVDTFVFFDDVNYIKRGWINRNNILTQSGPQRITLPVRKASQNRPIKDHLVGEGREKLVKTIELSYGKAPHFTEVMPFLEETILHCEENLSAYLENSLKCLASLLSMNTEFSRSSDVVKPEGSLKAADLILYICSELEADHYVNPEGGRELYDVGSFAAKDIQLSFLHYQPVGYPQFKKDAEFISHLSVIDALMFTGVAGTRDLLSAYKLES